MEEDREQEPAGLATIERGEPAIDTASRVALAERADAEPLQQSPSAFEHASRLGDDEAAEADDLEREQHQHRPQQ